MVTRAGLVRGKETRRGDKQGSLSVMMLMMMLMPKLLANPHHTQPPNVKTGAKTTSLRPGTS